MIFTSILCMLLITHSVYGVLTEKQIAATKRLLKNTCQTKSKASDEDVEAMQHGNFDTSENAKCYIHCILSTYKIINGIVFDWEASIKVLKANAPESMAGPAMVSLTNCKDCVKSTEKCAAANDIARCIYNDNPPNYMFP